MYDDRKFLSYKSCRSKSGTGWSSLDKDFCIWKKRDKNKNIWPILCLFTYCGIQSILCVFVLSFFVLCNLLSVSLDWPFVIPLRYSLTFIYLRTIQRNWQPWVYKIQEENKQNICKTIYIFFCITGLVQINICYSEYYIL